MTDTVEDEIAAALKALDNPLPTVTTNETSAEPQQQPVQDGLQESGEPPMQEPTQGRQSSPTLEALDESRRPKARTACEHCPNSVWFSTPAEVKCYCRVMFLITWSNKEPSQFTNCDGIYLGQE